MIGRFPPNDADDLAPIRLAIFTPLKKGSTKPRPCCLHAGKGGSSIETTVAIHMVVIVLERLDRLANATMMRPSKIATVPPVHSNHKSGRTWCTDADLLRRNNLGRVHPCIPTKLDARLHRGLQTTLLALQGCARYKTSGNALVISNPTFYNTCARWRMPRSLNVLPVREGLDMQHEEM